MSWDPWMTGRAAVWAGVVELGLRTSSVERVAGRCGVHLGTRRGAAPNPEASGRYRREIGAVARVFRLWPFGPPCLRRSLTLGALLRSHRPTLRLGAARSETGVRFHAWLEIGGATIGEPSSVSETFRMLGSEAAAFARAS